MNHSPPKILIVADTYYPKIDGITVFLGEFIKRVKNNFLLHLLVPQFESKKNPLPIKTTFLETSRLLKPLPTYPSIKFSFKNLKKIKEAVRQADLLFVQGPALASFLSIHYAHQYHKKIVLYTHLLPWELFEKTASPLLNKSLYHFIRKIFLKSYNKSHLLLLPYPELKEELQRIGIKTPMQVAKLGIDINHFLPSPAQTASKKKLNLPFKTIIGYVGRISKEKNTLVLLEALKKLDPQKYFLLMVGDGQPEIVEKFKKTKNCLVTGFTNNVVDYLQAMDIFVMPSLIETTSLATLEAMSCGLPVIVTKVGFMKEYITKDYNGLFFPRANPTILALKIEKLERNPPLRQKLSHNARKTIASSFSWERSINKIKTILLKVYYQP